MSINIRPQVVIIVVSFIETKVIETTEQKTDYSDLDYDWVISEVLEHKKPYLGRSHRRTNTFLELEANKIKERLQKRTHEEVKNGPEALTAVIDVLKKQLTHSVASILGIEDKQVNFVSEVDKSFKAIDSSENI